MEKQIRRTQRVQPGKEEGPATCDGEWTQMMCEVNLGISAIACFLLHETTETSKS